MFDVLDLVDRRTANLAHGFGSAVQPVNIRLADQTTVCIHRQGSVELAVAIANEIHAFALAAETPGFEMLQQDRREMVVELGDLDVAEGVRPDCSKSCRGHALGGHHLGEVALVEVRDRIDREGHVLGARDLMRTGGWLQVARPLEARSARRPGRRRSPGSSRASAEDRLDDPPRALMVLDR